MKLPQQDAEKRKKFIIVLLVIIIADYLLPLIMSLWLYLIFIPIAAFCGYMIYRFYLDYREFADAKKLCDCVIEKEIKKIGDIAKILGWSSAKTRKTTDFCFKKGYLDGFFLMGDELKKAIDGKGGEMTCENAVKSPRKCNHCGAVSEYPQKGVAICRYCGNIIDKQ